MLSAGAARRADLIGMVDARRPLAALVLGVLLATTPGAFAQSLPAVQKRLKELEARVEELEAEADKREKEDLKKEVEKLYSKGIISIGGVNLRLGGELKINLNDPQNEQSAVFGSTESPDPYLEIQRMRISPSVEFPKSDTLGQITLRTQIDIEPAQGDTILKRAALEHEVKPRWWLKSFSRIGLWDRFMRPARLTENYPLSGQAFWRDQTVGLFWEGTLGAKRGSPIEKSKKSGRARKEEEEPEGGVFAPEGGGGAERVRDDSSFAESDDPDAGKGKGEPVPSRSSQTNSTEHEPFDFVENPGAVKLHASIADGFGLAMNEIGREGATFNQILQDDRNFDPPLSLGEVGLGLGYERDFRELGEIELLGFFFEDELTDDMLVELTTQTGIASTTSVQGRRGGSVGYHFESYHLYKALNVLDTMNPRNGDGLYLFYQWIDARDGDLDRTGWYAQASFRISNPIVPRWRYFRSIEPVVRYSELIPDTAHVPNLPATWTRRQWLVGAILEVVKDLYIRTEYTFNDETTGGGAVSNNELLIQLLAEF